MVSAVLLSGCSDSVDEESSPLEQARPPPATQANETQPPEIINATAPPLPFEYVGNGCSEFLALIHVPVANVRHFIPDNMTLVGEATGETMFFAGLKSCDEMSVNGGAAQPGMVSDVGVIIEAPDGSDGVHYYQIWMLSDHQDFVRVHEALGVWSSLVATNYTEAELAPGIVEADVQIPWEEGTYRADGTTVGVPEGPPSEFIGWHWGSAGLFKIEKTFTYSHYAAGESEMIAEADSPMQTLLGSVFKDGLGLSNRYDHSGHAALVTP